jgi:hypothetical protein
VARYEDEVGVENGARDLRHKSVETLDESGRAAPGAVAIDQGIAKRASAGVRAPAPPSAILRLQRTIGNAGTTAYLQRDDLDEADAGHSPGDGHDHGATSPVHSTIASGGTPLDRETRSSMESHLGTDLSDVRLHVDRGSAESVQAAAYTVGNDVVVHPDHFQAGTPSAQRTLAHELTHVVQQRNGPVDGTERDGGIKVSDPSDRFEQEAEESASRFSSSVQTIRVGTGGGASAASVQRSPAAHGSEDEEVQTLALSLQRDGGDEEESEEE